MLNVPVMFCMWEFPLNAFSTLLSPDLSPGNGALIAVLASLGGSLCRWYFFHLSRPDGLKGVILGSVLAGVFAQANPPLLETLLGTLPPFSAFLIKGFLTGLFGVVALGIVQDIIIAYGARKEDP